MNYDHSIKMNVKKSATRLTKAINNPTNQCPFQTLLWHNWFIYIWTSNMIKGLLVHSTILGLYLVEGAKDSGVIITGTTTPPGFRRKEAISCSIVFIILKWPLSLSLWTTFQLLLHALTSTPMPLHLQPSAAATSSPKWTHPWTGIVTGQSWFIPLRSTVVPMIITSIALQTFVRTTKHVCSHWNSLNVVFQNNFSYRCSY